MTEILYENLFKHMAKIRKDDADGKPGYQWGERPFKMYFDGVSVTGKLVGGVDCSGSTLSAVYLEWQEVQKTKFKPKSKDKIEGDFYKYWVPYANLDGNVGFREASAGAAHKFLKATIGDGGDYNVFKKDNFPNFRRGDLVQVWWKGNDAGKIKKKYKKEIKAKVEASKLAHKKDPKKPELSEDDVVKSFYRMSGHSVFVHDTLVDGKGRVWFQMLSAQYNTDTKGIGVAGSHEKIYDDSAATQKKLFEKGKWYLYDEGKVRVDAVIPEMSVARFKRPFPCWPCALAGDKKNPGAAVVVKQAARYNRQIDQSNAGGYYPIGLNRTWHGGVHFRPKKGSAVYAVADGVIVAARCPEIDAKLDEQRKLTPQAKLPSRSFVLIRHQVEIDGSEKVFYSLTMHLAGDPPADDLVKARWLWKTRQRPARNLKIKEGARVRLDGGEVVKLAEPIGAGETIGFSADDAVHVEIFSEKDITDGDYHPNKLLVEDTDKDLVIDEKKLLKLLDDKVNLRHSWSPSVFGGGDWQKDDVITAIEVRYFFVVEDEAKRKVLRGLVTKHISEWSEKVDWDKLGDLESWGYMEQEQVDDLAKTWKLYMWLTKDIQKHCKLPGSHELVHYHPVTFLAWLRSKALAGKAEAIIQDAKSFHEGAGQKLEIPKKTLWHIDDDARGIDGKPLEGLGVFKGTADVPGLKKKDMLPAKEAGPWTAHKEWEVPKKKIKFIRITEDSASDHKWVPVEWSGTIYAEQRGSPA